MNDDAPKSNPSPEPQAPVPPAAPEADAPSEPKLSPEEQMARFEDALKEEDWGHQPC